MPGGYARGVSRGVWACTGDGHGGIVREYVLCGAGAQEAQRKGRTRYYNSLNAEGRKAYLLRFRIKDLQDEKLGKYLDIETLDRTEPGKDNQEQSASADVDAASRKARTRYYNSLNAEGRKAYLHDYGIEDVNDEKLKTCLDIESLDLTSEGPNDREAASRRARTRYYNSLPTEETRKEYLSRFGIKDVRDEKLKEYMDVERIGDDSQGARIHGRVSIRERFARQKAEMASTAVARTQKSLSDARHAPY